MTTKTDADVFHTWVVGEGLFAGNVTLPATVTAADVETISPVADPARDVLRKKGTWWMSPWVRRRRLP